MRPIDADRMKAVLQNIQEHMERDKTFAADSLSVFLGYMMGVVDSQPTIEPHPNTPLTLAELREMDGCPVWIVGVSSINDFKGHWDICDWGNGEVILFPYCMENPNKYSYGVTWTAYRRKPEEGAM